MTESTAPQSVDELDEIITRPNEGGIRAIQQCSGDFAVLGAGGKMGFHVTRQLQRTLEQLGRRDTLTAVSRFSQPASREAFERHGIRTVSADLSESDQLANAPTAENVIYLAGVKFGTASNATLLERMNATMPRHVASRYRDSRIVALSTGCVYSFTTAASGGSTENDATDPPGDYAKSCLDREQAFIDAAADWKTRSALIRLNYSIDLRYGVLVDIAQQVREGTPIDLATGHVNVIWQGDAVTQIIRCLPLTKAPPLILNVTGSQTLSVRDIAEQFGKRIGREPQFVGREASTCWLSNNAQAVGLFGEPVVSPDCMIDWIVDWLNRDGPTLGKPTHFQTRDGNY